MPEPPKPSERVQGMLNEVPLEHYAMVGKVASNWAVFEYLVNTALWKLAKVDDEPGACITAQIGQVGRSLDALAALVRLRGGSDDLVSKVSKFAEKSGNLARQRNRIVHDPWVMNWVMNLAPRTERFEISAAKRLVFGYQPVSTEDVSALVEKIADHIDKFDLLMKEIEGELPPSPDTQTQPSP